MTRQWGVLGVLCLALLLLGVDQTVLNVALPQMQRDLHLGSAQLQWVVGAHMLALAAGVLAAGNWGDRRGRRRALVAGLVICGLASVLGALADSAAEIIAARAVMGLGAAFIMPSTLSVLVQVFPQPARQRLAITIWSTVAGVGVLLGPVSGGWLLEHCSWRACFWGTLPLVVLPLCCVPVLVPPCRDDQAPPPDPAGLLLSGAGLFAVIWSFIQAPVLGWTDPLVVGVAALGATLLAAMICWERRAPAPMLPLGFFRDRGYAVAATMLCLMFFTLVGATFLLTFYLQGLKAMSPLAAGRTLLAGGLAVAVGGLVSAVLARRTRARTVMAVGMLLNVCAFVVLAGTTAGSSLSRLYVFLSLIGLGVGLAGGPATSLIMRAVPQRRAGIGAGVNDAVRSVGSTSGVAVVGSVFNTVYSSRIARSPGAPVPAGARDHLLGALAQAERLVSRASTGRGRLQPSERLRLLGAARHLAEDAAQAFTAALRTTSWLSAGICCAGCAWYSARCPAAGRRHHHRRHRPRHRQRPRCPPSSRTG
ncbi:MFS transporter [Streptomyces sp. MST-110588]|uniref:MFS transporter n=1 Tax=Streptomyces sp. MST-110588 TaxID=2833628 RepID=UPI001F5C7A64|nr:MFS transporter [Streptomyces sp. MST-110588]UNO38469.1 MFS transporter [Streptomyces sp. MST-110588]